MATSWFWIANFVLDPKEGAMCDPASAKPRRHAPGRPIFQSVFGGIAASILFAAAPGPAGTTVAQAAKPNIIFIMGDDIGWFNIGAYHQGMMAGKTPNLDQLAAEGMRFTDYYAEPILIGMLATRHG
jgi:hypothetical protein